MLQKINHAEQQRWAFKLNHGEITHRFCPSTHHEHIRCSGWMQIACSDYGQNLAPAAGGFTCNGWMGLQSTAGAGDEMIAEKKKIHK